MNSQLVTGTSSNLTKTPNCDNYFLYIFAFYVFSLYYAFKKHTKFIGFLMLIITYIASGGYLFKIKIHEQLKGLFNDSNSPISPNILLFGLFCVFFLNVYAQVRVLDTYVYVGRQKQTFDFKMDNKYQKTIETYTKIFLSENVILLTFFYLISVYNKMISGSEKYTKYAVVGGTLLSVIGLTLALVSKAHDFTKLKHAIL